MRTGDASRNNVTRDGSSGVALTTTSGVSGTAVHYFEIGDGDAIAEAVQISWTDATSSATISLESTNFNPSEAAVDVAAGYYWYPEPVTVTGPVASAASTFMLPLGNVGQRRFRLKVTVIATTKLLIRTWGKS